MRDVLLSDERIKDFQENFVQNPQLGMKTFAPHLKTLYTESFPEWNFSSHSPNPIPNSTSPKNSIGLNPHSDKTSQGTPHKELVHPAACENALRDSHKRLLNIKASNRKKEMKII